MPRDYGQRSPGGNRHARGKNEMPGWVWMLVGLSIGLGVAAFIYISRPLDPSTVAAAKKTEARKPIALPPEVKSTYDFYKILPNLEVVIPRSEPAPGSSPAKLDPGAYVVQVAAFTERNQAEEQKARLALLGFESRVEQGTSNGKKWFRVLIGPDKDPGRLHAVITRLKENQIDGFLVRVPG